MFPLLMALHVLGLLMWVGGAAAAAKLRAGGAPGGEPLQSWFLYRMAHPGMLLSILSGIGMLFLNSGYFFKEGWLYAKLVCAALAVAATVRPNSKLLWGSVGLALLLVFLRPF